MTDRSSGGPRKGWKAHGRVVGSGEVIWGNKGWEVTEMTGYRSWNSGRGQWEQDVKPADYVPDRGCLQRVTS